MERITFCSACGEPNPARQDRCSSCGAPLRKLSFQRPRIPRPSGLTLLVVAAILAVLIAVITRMTVG